MFFMKFSLIAAPEVAKIKASSAANEKKSSSEGTPRF